jgi:hypothetical protein
VTASVNAFRSRTALPKDRVQAICCFADGTSPRPRQAPPHDRRPARLSGQASSRRGTQDAPGLTPPEMSASR